MLATFLPMYLRRERRETSMYNDGIRLQIYYSHLRFNAFHSIVELRLTPNVNRTQSGSDIFPYISTHSHTLVYR